MSASSSSSSESTAAAVSTTTTPSTATTTSAPATKLKATAKEWKPSTAAAKLNPKVSEFKPTFNASAATFVPGAPVMQQPMPYQQPYAPQMGRQFPMGAPMMPGAMGYYPPPPYMQGGMPFYPQQQFAQPNYPMGFVAPNFIPPHMMQQIPPQQLPHQPPHTNHSAHPSQQQNATPAVKSAGNAPLLATPNTANANTSTPAAANTTSTPAPKKDAPTFASAAASKPAAPAAEEKASPAPAETKPTAPNASPAPVTAPTATEKPGANAAASFGVKPVVAAYKAKPAAERERKPKQAENDEQDIKEARLRANSNAEPEEPAATKPANVTVPASTSTANVVSSPNSRKQTTADAESSLDKAIASSTGAGGLQYNRDFLLQFQSLNTTPPENLLSSIEAILKGADNGGGFDLAPGARGMAPGKMGSKAGTPSSRIMGKPGATPVPQGASGPTRAAFGGSIQAPRTGNNRAPQGTGRGKRPDQPMDIEIKPLEQSANRYVKLTDIPGDVAVIRQLNAILNKLTPEKFDVLVDQVMALNISSAALLRDVVTTVFEKALAEPNYSPVYAEFAVKLSAKLPSFPADESDQQNTHNFKRLVLNQCQQEFENQDPTCAAVGEDGKPAPGRITKEEFEALTAEGKAEYLGRLKRRTLGTIRFIGELYVRAMLASKIMRSCIALLMGSADDETPSEENIEALCKLLETVGKLMDNKSRETDYKFITSIFDELAILAQPPSKTDPKHTDAGRPVLSSRLRFMIQDTIDLRKKDWVVRRKNEVNAKKISEVHKESAQPAPQDQRATSALKPGSTLRLGQFGVKKDRYNVGPGSPSPRAGTAPKADDGWDTVKSSKGRGGSQDVRGTSMARANSGSAATSSANTPSHRSGPPTPQKSTFRGSSDKPEKKEDGKNNAFALLNAGGDEDDDDSARSPQRGEDEEGTQDDEEATGGEDEDVPQLSDSQITDRILSFMKEYFSTEDFSEVETSIKEIGGRDALSADAVSQTLMVAIDGKDRDRAALTKLLPLLYNSNYLTQEQIEGGFSDTLAQSEDMGVDLPRMIEQLSAMVASLIHEKIFDLQTAARLSKVITAEEDQIKYAYFLLVALKKLQEAAGADFVQLVQDSGLKWRDLAGESQNAEQAKKLLNDKKLDSVTSILL